MPNESRCVSITDPRLLAVIEQLVLAANGGADGTTESQFHAAQEAKRLWGLIEAAGKAEEGT